MTPPTSSSHGIIKRHKVTIACDHCRKRRAKCSATLPCAFCEKHNVPCTYNPHRRPRGPRPKTKTVTQNFDSLVDISVDDPFIQETVTTSTAVIAPPPASPPNSDDFSPSHSQSHSIPPDHTWRNDLRELLPSSDPFLPDIGLVIHLIELFWVHASTQIGSIIPTATFFQNLKAKRCSASLCYAMSASGVRFSCHKSAQTFGEVLAAELVQRARQELHPITTANRLECIQTYCVLIDYEASRGNGTQVWTDVALSKSLIQIARAAGEIPPESTHIFDSAHDYLSIMGLIQSFGHPALQDPSPIQPVSVLNDENRCKSNSFHQLSRLLELFVRIQKSCSEAFTDQNPAPWSPNSRYKQLQEELYEYPILRPDTFCFGMETLQSWVEENDTELITSALIWHCCLIYLNRVFLPVFETQDSTVSFQRQRQISNFPCAPDLFIKERSNACSASAATICIICKELIMSGRFFFTPLAGYSMFQSALVLINQIGLGKDSYGDDVVDHLKILFIALGAMRNFFAPAHSWIEVLFRVHDATLAAPLLTTSLDDAFSSYFARFQGIDEPPLVPLNPILVPSGKRGMVSPEESTAETSTLTKENQPTTLQKHSDWLSEYANNLQEELSSCDLPSGSQEQTHHSTETSPSSLAATAPLLPPTRQALFDAITTSHHTSGTQATQIGSEEGQQGATGTVLGADPINDGYMAVSEYAWPNSSNGVGEDVAAGRRDLADITPQLDIMDQVMLGDQLLEDFFAVTNQDPEAMWFR